MQIHKANNSNAEFTAQQVGYLQAESSDNVRQQNKNKKNANLLQICIQLKR